MKAHTTVNYDETCVYISLDEEICLEHVSKDRAQKKGPKGKSIRSLVSFIAADGKVIMSVWIFRAKMTEKGNERGLMETNFHIQANNQNCHGSWKRFYTFTKTGYSNKEIHKAIIEQFCNKQNELYPGETC